MGCPLNANATHQKEFTNQTSHICQKCGKDHNKRGSHDTDDECDDPVYEIANEPVNAKESTNGAIVINKHQGYNHKSNPVTPVNITLSRTQKQILKRKIPSIVFN